MSKRAPGRRWTRDELLVAFNLYCRTPFGRLHSHNTDIIDLAVALDRTPNSVAMKLCNFASLDPVQQARGIKGLRGASAADRELVGEFLQDWESIANQSEVAMERFGLTKRDADESDNESMPDAAATESERVVRVRRVQHLFRSTILASYDDTCAFSGIHIPTLLVASHIIPWSIEASRRLDPSNGLALSALHDRAFDRGLLAVDDDSRILVSRKLRIDDLSNVHRVALLEIEGRRIRPPSRFAPDPEALRWHRENVFQA